jgi:hypothetical protein
MKLNNLFIPGKDWENNACINAAGNPEQTYSLGYKEAADFLANNASDVSLQDLFIYPIAFLYRHHLELHLKMIIKHGNQLLNKNAVLRSNHDLKKLWKTAKEIILKIWSQGDPMYLNPVDHVISEYHKLDPNSTAFRYSYDFEGNNNLQDIHHINISALSKSVNKAAAILDNIYDGLIEFSDAKAEMMNY